MSTAAATAQAAPGRVLRPWLLAAGLVLALVGGVASGVLRGLSSFDTPAPGVAAASVVVLVVGALAGAALAARAVPSRMGSVAAALAAVVAALLAALLV